VRRRTPRSGSGAMVQESWRLEHARVEAISLRTLLPVPLSSGRFRTTRAPWRCRRVAACPSAGLSGHQDTSQTQRHDPPYRGARRYVRAAAELDLTVCYCTYLHGPIDEYPADDSFSIGSDHPEYGYPELRRRFEEFASGLPDVKREGIGFCNLQSFLGWTPGRSSRRALLHRRRPRSIPMLSLLPQR
jgi:hypothetical protein